MSALGALALQSLAQTLDSLTDAQRLWLYFTMGFTAIFTEEAAPLLGGLAARAGHFRLTLVGAWISVGTWVAGVLLFYLGRWRGTWVRQRWPSARTVLLRALRLVRRHPWRAAIASRFAFGLRITLPIACGAARVPVLVYFIGSAISAVLWSFFFTIVGWGFGEAALRVLGHLRRYERWIALGIVLLVLLAFVIMRRRHVEEEVVKVLEHESHSSP